MSDAPRAPELIPDIEAFVRRFERLVGRVATPAEVDKVRQLLESRS